MSNVGTPRRRAEGALDVEYAQSKGIEPVLGLLRFCCPEWAVERMVNDLLIQQLHLTCLRRISEALGHPLKNVPNKTAVDLADLAVAAIRAGHEKDATR
jgi:hypothetical protein